MEYFFNWAKKSKLPTEFKVRSFSQAAQKFVRERGFTPKYVTVAKMIKS